MVSVFKFRMHILFEYEKENQNLLFLEEFNFLFTSTVHFLNIGWPFIWSHHSYSCFQDYN